MRIPPAIELYLLILRAHLRFIVTMVLAATLTAVSLTYVFSEKYYAASQILVRPVEQAILVGRAKESFGYPIGLNIPIETITQTHEEILHNPVMLEAIVDRLQLDAPAPPPQGPRLVVLLAQAKMKARRWLSQAMSILKYGRLLPEDARSAAIERLGRALKTRPTAQTHILEVGSQASDPQVAAAIANAAAELLRETSRDLTSEKERDFRIYLERQLQDADREVNETRSALEAFKTRSEIVAIEEEGVLGLRSEAKMREELRQLEAKREGLSLLYEEAHPLVAGLNAQIALIRGELELGVRPKLRNLPHDEAEIGRLRLALASAEARYRQVRDQVEQARIAEANRQSQVRIVSPALAPTAPQSPIKILYGGLAAFLALVIGLAWSFVDHFLRVPVYTAEQAESALAVPNLVELPPLGVR